MLLILCVIAISILGFVAAGSAMGTLVALLIMAMTVRFYESGLASLRFYTEAIWLVQVDDAASQDASGVQDPCRQDIIPSPPRALNVADDAKDAESFKNIPWYSLRWFGGTYQFVYKTITRREKKTE